MSWPTDKIYVSDDRSGMPAGFTYWQPGTSLNGNRFTEAIIYVSREMWHSSGFQRWYRETLFPRVLGNIAVRFYENNDLAVFDLTPIDYSAREAYGAWIKMRGPWSKSMHWGSWLHECDRSAKGARS